MPWWAIFSYQYVEARFVTPNSLCGWLGLESTIVAQTMIIDSRVDRMKAMVMDSPANGLELPSGFDYV
jgi:hypothetical protein